MDNEFNIGFNSPSADTCGYFALISNKMKISGITEQEKQTLMTEKTINKRRAKAFYDLLREEPEKSKTIVGTVDQRMAGLTEIFEVW